MTGRSQSIGDKFPSQSKPQMVLSNAKLMPPNRIHPTKTISNDVLLAFLMSNESNMQGPACHRRKTENDASFTLLTHPSCSSSSSVVPCLVLKILC
uniref:Uncharacterized protein n=1 Tax=viral metagenome TaxID=1070528 RepID=A0A6C0IYM2_9ZZZZ